LKIFTKRFRQDQLVTTQGRPGAFLFSSISNLSSIFGKSKRRLPPNRRPFSPRPEFFQISEDLWKAPSPTGVVFHHQHRQLNPLLPFPCSRVFMECYIATVQHRLPVWCRSTTFGTSRIQHAFCWNSPRWTRSTASTHALNFARSLPRRLRLDEFRPGPR
jgi:hypothetical protein